MLLDFQRALAALTGSPEMTAAVRRDPNVLTKCYDLTPRERDRLADVAAGPGIRANVALYRANRLAPIVLNLPGVCDALGSQLKPLLSAYWKESQRSDAHFLVEAERFRQFVATALEQGALEPGVAMVVAPVLEEEGLRLALHLAASRGPLIDQEPLLAD